MALSQLITTTDVANSNIGINNEVVGKTNAVALGNGQNVGIGTNAPLSGLHIGNTGSTIPAIYLADSTGATLPTIGANDGIFSVLAGSPTFVNAGGAQTLFAVGTEALGTSTLVAGTVTINTANAISSSSIFLTRTTTTGSVATIGTINVASIVNGVSFTVNSTVVTDVGSFNYLIINA